MDSQDPGEGQSRISTADGLDSDAVGFCVCACVCTHVCVPVCVQVFKQSPDPLPQPGRKTSKGSWGLAQGGMMLNSRRSGALIRAMALKSNFMVKYSSPWFLGHLCVFIITICRALLINFC